MLTVAEVACWLAGAFFDSLSARRRLLLGRRGRRPCTSSRSTCFSKTRALAVGRPVGRPQSVDPGSVVEAVTAVTAAAAPRCALF